jgi:O-antigen/teichoic acid export membrane protein
MPDETDTYQYPVTHNNEQLSLKQNYLWLLLSRIVSSSLSFVAWAFANRALGPESRGIVGEIQTWIGLFLTLFNLGINNAVYHYANKERYTATDGTKLVTALTMTIGYSLSGIIALFAVSNLWPHQFSALALKYNLILCLLFGLQFINTFTTTFLQALGRIKYVACLNLLQALINILLIASGYVLGRLDIFYFLITLVLIQLICCVTAIVFLNKLKLFRGCFSWQLAKKLLATGLKQYIVVITAFLYTKINQLFVLWNCGAYEAGLFIVSLNLTTSLLFIPATLQIALFPRVLHAHDDYEITIRSLRMGFYGWGLLVVLLIILAEPILLLYGGEKFLPAAGIFRLHLVATWFLPLASFIDPYYIKIGAFFRAALVAVMLCIISLGLNLVLVAHYAALGGAMATAITCFIDFLAALLFFNIISHRNIWDLFRPEFRAEFGNLRALLRKKF